MIACNEAGPDQPSKPSVPITAGVMKYKPGPPEGLNPDRVTKSSVALSWRPPKDDGGSKIVGYIVEMKHKDDKDFHDVNTVPHPGLFYTVTSVTEHEEYCFRVSAVNDIGRGDPCRATNYVKVGEMPNQPKIDLGCVKDVRVKAGDDFSLNINYTGFPQPTAQFWNNDTLLEPDNSRIYIKIVEEVVEEYVSIIVKKAVREDAGHYRLRLTNDAGYDTATFKVSNLQLI